MTANVQKHNESSVRYQISSGLSFRNDFQILNRMALSAFSKSGEYRNQNKYYDPFIFALKKAFEFAEKNHCSPGEAFESVEFKKRIKDWIADWIGNIKWIPEGSSYACWGPTSPFQRIMHHIYDHYYAEVEDTVKMLLRKFKTFDEALKKRKTDEDFLALAKRIDDLNSLAIDINQNLEQGKFGIPQDPFACISRQPTQTGCLIPILAGILTIFATIAKAVDLI